MDGQKGESGRSVESGRSRGKVDDLLTKTGRSFRKCTVPQKVDCPTESGWSPILNSLWGEWTVQRMKVDDRRGESGRSEEA